MNEIIFLDSEPLGLASHGDGRPKVDRCKRWLDELEASGVRIVVPEIIDYEVRRELTRVNATSSLDRLDTLLDRFYYLSLDRETIVKAAELWALVRSAGLPTAHPHSLDADAILAA